MTYKAGDKVWAYFFRSDLALFGDKAAVVLGPHAPCADGPRYDLEIVDEDVPKKPPGTYGGWNARSEELRPRHDPYDGDQAGNWDDCPFNPTKEKAV